MQATGRRYGGIPDGNVSGGQRLGRYGPPPQVGKNRRSKIPTVKCRNPTGCKRLAKVPTKPEGPESRTARYQIGDIRSYLFNNITFYGAFLQSPHSRLSSSGA